ncbi:MAG: hypothetical protein NVS3B19_03200 [Ginsengibacter sp.]
MPGSVQVDGLNQPDYEVDYINSVVLLKQPSLNANLSVSYRVFPFKFNQTFKKYDYDSIRFNFALEPKPIISNTGLPIFDFGNFQYSGSIGRGLSVGNTQDATVNSSLNLQLNGYLGDSLLLTAAISDNNIPSQPEGNTQQLSNFDQIFIKLQKRHTQLNFGDIDLRQNRHYFLNFYKRLQGVSFQTDYVQKGKTMNSLLLSGAIAKGKFAKNIITPSEGNQGPYRLSNPNNELYFIVLGNTERVFIDGQLLKRGDEEDYVIDYNTAEIRFTPKRLITRDSRIQVEFEYADRNFLNAQLYLNDEMKISNRLKVSVAAFSNSDLKNSPINQQLDPVQKLFLSSIGSNIDSARYANAIRDTFSANKILYKKIDTVYNNIHDSVYQYAPFKTQGLYNVSFLFVGSTKGSYIAQNENANGRVYKWVAPSKNNVPQGEWEPVALLVTPKKQQLISAGFEYIVSRNTRVTGELAVSNYDINTFSSKNKVGERGKAGRFIVTHTSPKIFRHIDLFTRASYEYVEDRFRPIERLRNIEFNRQWGLPFIATPATENLKCIGVTLNDYQQNSISFETTSYTRNNDYKGLKNVFNNHVSNRGWTFSDEIMFTQFKYQQQIGKYIRPSIDVSKKVANGLIAGGNFLAEQSTIRNQITDTLTSLSYAYQIWQGYLKTINRKSFNWGVNYFTRVNEYPSAKTLRENDKSDNISGYLEFLSNLHHQVKINATYRKLAVVNSIISNLKPENSFIGRTEYNLNVFNGFLNGSFLYEAGTGQEQKRAYVYIEVPIGQGQYTWIDYNNDGIPQLNEFELAVFQDQKKYVKIYTPTNEYVKANYVQFNYSLDLSPASIAGKIKYLRFVKLFNVNSTLQVNRKAVSNKAIDLNPFKDGIADTALISLYSFMGNSLFINRSSSNWGIDITHRYNENKSLLTYGFETRRIKDLSIKFRKGFAGYILSAIKGSIVHNELITPKFSNRNFSIIDKEITPEIIYTYRTNFRIGLNYTYKNKKNEVGLQQVINNSLLTDIKYNVLSNCSLTTRFTYNHIKFTGGEANSTTGFEMLEGLLPGQNFIMDIELQKRLAGNLEINFQYEGRKSGNLGLINTGRATLRAVF